MPPPEAGAPIDFAGFRGLTALNAPDTLTPFVIFAGASYFQAIARDQRLRPQRPRPRDRHRRARGRGVPVLPRPLDRGRPSGDRMVVHSLLDGPSATGAYRFTIRPGDETTIDVEATIFVRQEIAHLGPGAVDLDVPLRRQGPRPSTTTSGSGVHDSDGLAMWNGSDERLWRPLHSPRLLQISAFSDSGPRGFGLIQRERRFSEYEDLERALPPPARRSGSSRSATGAAATSCSSRSRPTRRSTTTSSPTGGRPVRSPAGSELSLDLSPALGLGRARPRRAAARRAHADRRRPRRPPTLRRRLRRRGRAEWSRASAVQLSAQVEPGSPARRRRSPRTPRSAACACASSSTRKATTRSRCAIDLRSGERPVAETWVYRWSQ